LADLARLARRICVLREQGEAAAAARLESSEFATAVRDIRLAEGPDSLPEGELQAIFAVEEKRVADAAVLAELLAPRLVTAFASFSAMAPRPRENVAATRSEAVPFSRAAEPAAGSLAIPDLLDAMLAADSAARRQAASRRTG